MEDIDPEGLPLLKGYHARDPDLTFTDRLTLRLKGRTLEFLHAPGHLVVSWSEQ